MVRRGVAWHWLFVLVLLAGVVLAACNNGGDDDSSDDTGGDDAGDDSGADDTGGDDTGDDDTGPWYDPTWVVPMRVLPDIRGFHSIRGIVHAHSWYSHDACDSDPVGNTECLMQMREAFCRTQQDFIMLTDHASYFADHEYPDVLLYLPDEGDELVYDDDNLPIANRITCPGGFVTTLMAGTENDLMPVHIHHHVEGTNDDRHALYGRSDPAAVPLMQDLGATVIVNHDEGWAIPDLVALQPDGVEIFQLHAAIMPDMRVELGVDPIGYIFDILSFLRDPYKPAPNLMLMAFFPVTEAWNERWDAILQTKRCIGTAGTDVHRNALPFDLSDGERADGYRRMMQFFSNHLLVPDDEVGSIETALDRGRMYTAFEYLGFPYGFDFYATDGTTIYEMGDEPQWTPGLTIHVKPPVAVSIDPNGPQPEIWTELIRVDASGSEPVAYTTGTSEIVYAVDSPAVFRAEIHITPHHLLPFLGTVGDKFMHDYPWVLANPIYVTGE